MFRRYVAFIVLFCSGLAVGTWNGMFGGNVLLTFGVAMAANIIAHLVLGKME